MSLFQSWLFYLIIFFQGRIFFLKTEKSHINSFPRKVIVGGQTDRQTKIKTDKKRQTDRQKYRQTKRLTKRQNKKKEGQLDRKINRQQTDKT